LVEPLAASILTTNKKYVCGSPEKANLALI
jgi:hypothetical protein